MNSYAESDHPRSTGGRFTTKPAAAESRVEIFAPDDVTPEDSGLPSVDRSWTPRVGTCHRCGEPRTGQVSAGTHMPGTSCAGCGDVAPDLADPGARLHLDSHGVVTGPNGKTGPDEPGWDSAVITMADPGAVRDALRAFDPDEIAAEAELAAAERERAMDELDDLW